jgi:hypothetical protein
VEKYCAVGPFQFSSVCDVFVYFILKPKSRQRACSQTWSYFGFDDRERASIDNHHSATLSKLLYCYTIWYYRTII